MSDKVKLSNLAFMDYYKEVKGLYDEISPYLIESSTLYQEVEALNEEVAALEKKLKRQVMLDLLFSFSSLEMTTYHHLFMVWPEYSPKILEHAEEIMKHIDEQYHLAGSALQSIFDKTKEALEIFKKIDTCSQPFFADNNIDGYKNWLHSCATVGDMIETAKKFYEPSEKRLMLYGYTAFRELVGIIMYPEKRLYHDLNVNKTLNL